MDAGLLVRHCVCCRTEATERDEVAFHHSRWRKNQGLNIPSSGPKASMKKKECSDGKHEAYLRVAVTLALTIVGCSVSPAKQSEHPSILAANLDSYPSVD